MRKTFWTLFIILFLFNINLTAKDKYFSKTLYLNKIFRTSLGLIVAYYSESELRISYLPEKFFRAGSYCVEIPENSSSSGTMSLIYRNGEIFRVKIYIPSIPIAGLYGMQYKMTDEDKQKFNIDKPVFEKKNKN